MAEGSQTFEQDIARLINEGVVTRDEGLAQADSPTNLLWRLQQGSAPPTRVAPQEEEPEQASFTDITIDVGPDDDAGAPPWARPS